MSFDSKSKMLTLSSNGNRLRALSLADEFYCASEIFEWSRPSGVKGIEKTVGPPAVTDYCALDDLLDT